jgi:hypothetical protein
MLVIRFVYVYKELLFELIIYMYRLGYRFAKYEIENFTLSAGFCVMWVCITRLYFLFNLSIQLAIPFSKLILYLYKAS